MMLGLGSQPINLYSLPGYTECNDFCQKGPADVKDLCLRECASDALAQSECSWWQKYRKQGCDYGMDCPQCRTRPEIMVGITVALALIAWKVLS